MTSAGATVSVRVQPRARRDEIAAVRSGVLVVRVVAPPVDGRPNDAVRRIVSERLGVPPSRVRLLRGQRSRDKVLQVEGLDQAAVDDTLGL